MSAALWPAVALVAVLLGAYLLRLYLLRVALVRQEGVNRVARLERAVEVLAAAHEEALAKLRRLDARVPDVGTVQGRR